MKSDLKFEEMAAQDAETGQRVQERIQFYFLTLTFTLLALAIQTYKKGIYPESALFEFSGWLCLLLSGLLGLYRMHLIPKYFKLFTHTNILTRNLEDAEELKRKGEKQLYVPIKKKMFDIDLYINEHKEGIEHFQNEEKNLTKHLKPIIKIHELGLVAGIILLAMSRGYETVYELFNV